MSDFKHRGKNVKIHATAVIRNPELVSIGDNSIISDYALITGEVEIGKWCHIAHYTHLSGKKKITLGDFVGISARCSFYTSNDSFRGDSFWTPAPDGYRNPDSRPITIGNQVMFGCNCLVMPGVYVSEGVIFGARSFIKGRYFGDALFCSDGNHKAEFVKDLPDFYYNHKEKREKILNE